MLALPQRLATVAIAPSPCAARPPISAPSTGDVYVGLMAGNVAYILK